ncbi:hypothetical protein C8259_16715 [Nocardia nova]|uniref:Uncharacterized protein n=2 Tax=Nocardia TaxID=1817 RepID=A0A2T2Z472_9NOCA|nr:hypothetical protein C8259_16715 [Nocardia nova]
MMSMLFAHTALLAQNTTTNPTGPEFGKASPLGLVIILVLLAGTVLLIRSMNKHIKKLPADFSREHPEPDQEADEGTEHGVAGEGDDAAGGDRAEQPRDGAANGSGRGDSGPSTPPPASGKAS